MEEKIWNYHLISKEREVGRLFFSPVIGEEICLAIAIASKALRTLCDENSHWPNANTICEWRIRNKDFGEAYARAKQHQVEVLIDELLAYS